jgi:SAM-dependent methyltransferase
MIRLNLASGPNVFDGWLNIDRDDVEENYLRHLRGLETSQMHGWPPEQVELSKAITAGRIRFFQWDLRRGLPMYPDGSVDAVYGGQMVEHLNPIHEVPKFLAECYRVLKPGGRIRLTTPDLDALIHHYADARGWDGERITGLEKEQPAYYRDALPEDQLAYIMYGAGGTLEMYEGHQHLYTPRSLEVRLAAAGFSGIQLNTAHDQVISGGRAVPSVFADCIDKGMSHSFAIEGTKP